MIDVRIPSDNNFKYDECKTLYEKNKLIMNEDAAFEEVISNTFFYTFYDKNKFSLCVYFFEIDGKMWVNAFGIRKNYLFNKQCFKNALDWFNCDIWAKSVEKPAIYGLLNSGFQKYKNNIYVFRKK